MVWRRVVAVALMVALIVPIATGGRAQQGENVATPAPTAAGSPVAVPTQAPVTSLPSTGTGDQAGPGAWATGVVLTGLAAAGGSLILLRRRRV